ncbi:hypothetical protein U9M48_001504 [Paspalum notatum var. saurae]|uniref:RBR-type E3 ubiquitin transferase n=1 Tax=Paspalum notatum var. saurae TaxID=547442 RepID=A0AAQ3PEZ2_PASNO
MSLLRGQGIATVLLRHCDWSPQRVKDEWRQRRDSFCRDVGLRWPSGASEPEVIHTKRNQFCCKKTCPHAVAVSKRVTSAGCSHYYCDVCWRGHIGAAVHGGAKKSLSLRCLNGSCRAAVLWALVDRVADGADKDKISRYMLRSPVDDSGGRMKWCPAGRSCGRAIEFPGGRDARGKDLVVVCRCSYRFCWSCGHRPHRALSCDMARLWVDTIESRRSKDEMQAAKASGAYRRWKDCHASLYKAAKEAEGLKSSSSALRSLAHQVRADVAEFRFVTKAYDGIMACRRLIRWVYVYEYYHQDRCQQLRDRRNKADDMIKRLEGKAMGYRARIAHATRQEYSTFKSEVIKLTGDARHMVEKLVEAAETA